MSAKNKKEKSLIREVYEWVETFLFALAAVILIFTFVAKFVTVSGSSMEDSFHNNDRLLITSIGYTPKQGDVVVLDATHNVEQAGAPYIKRIIATEGQVVDIDSDTWTVYVDGEALDEPYVKRMYDRMYRGRKLEYPYTVPKGCVFVMGDNRNGSSDSRDIGPVEEQYILGKVFLRLIPDFGVIK